MHICSKAWQSDHKMLGQRFVLFTERMRVLIFFSVNYHVALRVCFSSKHKLRMPNIGLIACVT